MAIQNGKFRHTRKFFPEEDKDDFYDNYDNSLENDEISSEEAGFMQGYDNADY